MNLADLDALSGETEDKFFVDGSYARFFSFSLSTAGAVFGFITAWLLKTYKNVTNKMVLFILIADFVYVLLGMLDYMLPLSQLTSCNFIEAIRTYARVSSFCWTCCFSHALYAVVQTEDAQKVTGKFKRYFIASQVLPLPFMVFIYITPYMQLAKAKGQSYICYHYHVDRSFDYAMFLIYTLPFIITFFYTLTCYVIAIKTLKRRGLRHFFTLLVYPLITIVCWGPTMIIGLLTESKYQVSRGLFVTSAAFSGLQGFFDAMFYGLSYGVISGYKDKCKEWCKRRSEEDSEIRESQVSIQNILLERQGTQTSEVPSDEIINRAGRFHSLRYVPIRTNSSRTATAAADLSHL